MKSQCVSMVVPPPIAAPWTATTTGLSKLTNAFAWAWRILEKILDIVARAERISRAVPKDDLHVLVIRRLVEDTCESYVHGRRHRIPLGRAVQLHARMLPTSSVTISSNVIVDVLVPW